MRRVPVRAWTPCRGAHSLLRLADTSGFGMCSEWPRWPPRTTARRRSATHLISPARSPPSSGCRSASPSRFSASAACGSGPECWWRPARQRLHDTPARLGARTDVREHARGTRGGAAHPPPAPRGLAAGERRRTRGLLGALAAGTAISATVGPPSLLLGGVVTSAEHGGRVAYLVARRFHRCAGRGATRDRVVEAAATSLVAWTVRRGGGPACGRCRGERVRVASRSPLTYLVFPPLIWAALRFGQRGATGDRDHGRLHRLEHRPPRGPVLLPGDHPQRAEHAAVHRRRGARDPVPGRCGLRAGEVRRTAQRFPRPAGRGGGHRTPAPRAQPPRWGAAAPDGPRLRLQIATEYARIEPERAVSALAAAEAEVFLPSTS